MKKQTTSKSVNPVSLWFRVIRPHSLFASLCPVLVGLMIANKQIGYVGTQGHIVALLTIVCAMTLQVLSNLVNDYYDFLRGADTEGRVGFQRALAEGQVTAAQIRTACIVTLCIAVVFGAILCLIGGWVILLIGLSAILFAWLYTATDYSLSYLGIADIFVLIYYGLLATTGTVFLQYKAVGMEVLLVHFSSQLLTATYAGIVCGLISMCVLAINNIRDIEGDRNVNKKTFPVRFGKKAALTGICIIVALIPMFCWLAFGINWALLTFVPAVYMLYRTLIAQAAEYNQCLMLAGVVNLCYTILVWLSLM